jgi:hypothetical protein
MRWRDVIEHRLTRLHNFQLAAFERDEIVPNGEIFLFQLRPKLTRELSAVLARIRDEIRPGGGPSIKFCPISLGQSTRVSEVCNDRASLTDS